MNTQKVFTSGAVRPLDAVGATIVITGASGFVGGHIHRHLTGRFPGARILSAGRASGSAVYFDLNDLDSAANIVCESPDVVIHLAGEASLAGASRDASETWRATVLGTMGLARALSAYDRPYTLLFASSAEVYGSAFLGYVPVTEHTAPRPMSVYARCKLAVEFMLSDLIGANATLIVVRPSNHVGPGQAARFALPSFARQIAVGEKDAGAVTIRVGSLDAERDFLDVRDVVAAYGDLIAALHGSGRRSTFNVSSGTVRSVRSMLDMLVAGARVPCEMKIDDALVRPSEIPRAFVSPKKIEELIGWNRQYRLEQTVSDILDDARRLCSQLE